MLTGFEHFTFHYGRIKTEGFQELLFPGFPFTFHYGRIKTIEAVSKEERLIPLHSTMEGLKRLIT